MLFLSASLPDTSLLSIILSSAVISSLISGLVALIVARAERKTAIETDRHSSKTDLAVESYKLLQQALVMIDNENDMNHDSENIDDDAVNAVGIMFQRSFETMKLVRRTVEQIAFLLPESEVEKLLNEHAALEKKYVTLLKNAYIFKGASFVDKDSPDLMDPTQLPEKMIAFIDQTNQLVNNLKVVIINNLRKLFNT